MAMALRCFSGISIRFAPLTFPPFDPNTLICSLRSVLKSARASTGTTLTGLSQGGEDEDALFVGFLAVFLTGFGIPDSCTDRQ